MPNLTVESPSPPPPPPLSCLAAPPPPVSTRRLSGSAADSGPSSTGDPKAQSTSSWTWHTGDLRPSCETPLDGDPPARASAELETASEGADAITTTLARDEHTVLELRTAAAVAAAMLAHTTTTAPPTPGAATIRRRRTPSPPLPAAAAGGEMGSVGSASFALPVVETDRAVHRTSRKGKPVINHYVVDCEIGEGKFSSVRLVKHSKTKRTYAMKIMPRSCLAQLRLMADGDDRARLYRHEMAVLKRLRHPHIIALVEVIDDPVEQNLYLILELASEGPLAFVNRNGQTVTSNGVPYRLDEASARDVARALLAAIRYAHHNGVAHRDIKPENILRAEDGSLKLADFGVAKMIEDWPELRGDARELMLNPALSVSVDHPERDNPHSPTGRKVPGQETHGTPFFMSPESLSAAVRGIPEGIALDLSDLFLSDIWSFGVTMYALVVGRLPWTASTARGMALAIAAADTVPFPPECDEFLSPSLRDFLTAAIRVDPAERVSLRQLAHHPWVLGDPSWAAAAKTVALADGYSFTPSFPSAALFAASGAGPATYTAGSDVGASVFSNFSFDGASGGFLAAAAGTPPPPHAAPLFGVGATLPVPSVRSSSAGRHEQQQQRCTSSTVQGVEEEHHHTNNNTNPQGSSGRAEPERATSLSDSFAGETVRVDNEDLQDALASLQAMSISAGDLSFGADSQHQHTGDDTSEAGAAAPPPIDCVEAPAATDTAAPSPAAHPAPITPFNVSPPAALTAVGGATTPGSTTSPQSCVLSPHAMSTTQVFSSAGGSTLASPSGSKGAQAPEMLLPQQKQ